MNARELLQAAQDDGTRFLHELTAKALKRLGTNDKALAAPSLFTQAELQDFADSISESLAMGDLLGRSRIRQRMAALTPNVPAAFAEPTAPGSSVVEPFVFHAEIAPLPPAAALEFFGSLVPTLSIDPAVFVPEIRRQAFTLAASSEQALTQRVKDIILENLQSGAGTRAGAIQIEQTLDAAGVLPSNPQYSEMVYRTNAMGAYNRGAADELADPVVGEFFPCWQYIGIDDGRERSRHRVHFDRYYPNTVSFEAVRDSEAGKFDGYNCRCTFRPVSKYEWAKLSAAGAVLQTVP